MSARGIWCWSCGVVKDVSQFDRDESQPDGRAPECRTCHEHRAMAHRLDGGVGEPPPLPESGRKRKPPAIQQGEGWGNLSEILRARPASGLQPAWPA